MNFYFKFINTYDILHIYVLERLFKKKSINSVK